MRIGWIALCDWMTNQSEYFGKPTWETQLNTLLWHEHISVQSELVCWYPFPTTIPLSSLQPHWSGVTHCPDSFKINPGLQMHIGLFCSNSGHLKVGFDSKQTSLSAHGFAHPFHFWFEPHDGVQPTSSCHSQRRSESAGRKDWHVVTYDSKMPQISESDSFSQ